MHLIRPIISSLVALIFITASTAYAQPRRPDRGDGQAIKGKVQEVLDRTVTLGNNLDALCDAGCAATPAGGKFKSKVDRLKRAHARVNAAHGRAEDADYQEFARRRPKKVDDPQGAVVSAADSEFDEERGKDVIEDLDEVSTEIDELNAILAGNVPPTPPAAAVELENAQYFFPASMWPSSEVALAGFVANLAAEKAAAIADHFCDQTAVAAGFGGNGSAACSVVEGVHQVLDAAYQMIDYIGQDVTAAEVTGTYKRAKNIFDQLVVSTADMDDILLVVRSMGQKLLILEENQRKIMDLLTTPQGQRPGFPLKP
jgi:hypothetical protein